MAAYKIKYSLMKITVTGTKTVMGFFLDLFLLLYVYLSFFLSSFFLLEPPAFSSCKLRRQFYLNGMHKPGDVILGGLFEVHYTSVFPELAFTSEPNQLRCQG